MSGKHTGDDESIEEVFDGGEIAPALLGQDVGDIGDPFLVGASGDKVPVEYIRVGVVGSQFLQLPVHFPLSRLGVDAQLVHQAQHRFVVDDNLLCLSQPESDPAVTIYLVAGVIGLQDLFHPCLISIPLFQLMGPGIIGSSRNTKEGAHGVYRVLFSVVVDRPILRSASGFFRNSVWNFFSNATSISSRAI